MKDSKWVHLCKDTLVLLMPKRNQWECNSQGTILTSNNHR